ncbi:Polyketide synthase modules and related protein [Pyrenophora tritici-repentis]|nr:Polyketide synthase modules and related protein [Pyrenophora tritici-repentis]
MGRELIERYAVFRKALEKADNCISSLGSDWSIIGNEDKLLKDDLNSQVDKAEISMPLCCALQIALVCLLRSWNVHPTAVVGHSSGESAAAFAAGALDMRSAIAVQYYRGLLTGRLAGTRSTKGSMMAAGLSLEDAERYLSKVTSGKAVVGCHNSPLSVTLSGDADAIDELEILLKVDGVFTRKLNVPTAFHSHHMSHDATEYLKYLEECFTTPQDPLLTHLSSSVTGGWCEKASDFGPEHWVDYMLKPVRFADALSKLCSERPWDEMFKKGQKAVDVLIEIGPHGALAAPIRQSLQVAQFKDLQIGYISALKRNENAVHTMHDLAGFLWTRGYPVNLAVVNSTETQHNRPQFLTGLTPYPWNYQSKLRAESSIAKRYRLRPVGPDELIGFLDTSCDLSNPSWTNNFESEKLFHDGEQAKPPVLTSTNTRAIQEKLSNCTNVDTTTEYITKALTERLAQLMMLPVTDVDPNEPLSAYGVDSLVAVELRSWILKELSVQETLGAAVSQATTFESQFFESQTEEEGAAEGSQAGTAATTEASVDTEPDNGDNFDGINWDRLPRFMKPLTTGRRVKSWIFQHGYRVVELYDQNRVWFVCKYCHIHKVIDTGGSGVFDVSKATSSAAAHLGLQKRGHGFTKDGLKPRRTGQQLSLRQTLETGVAVSQEAANAMGNFNIQQFREVAVFCLLDNNLPMELLARPSFREMISLANPEAEAALWVSPRSVATYAMRLFQYMQPQIVCALSEAASKIHISFDGWTTKGGKRGFFGVVAHFANASGVIQDLPIALPHLAGSHTGDAIADTIKKTLQEYSIGSDKLGYFVLDNAANNDTAVSSLAHAYDFNAAHRRLRCGPHTLNLIGQAIIFGSNQEAYNNNNDEQLQTEEVYMQEWRQEGPLGVLIDVINHIKMLPFRTTLLGIGPMLLGRMFYNLHFHSFAVIFQTAANAELPARERLHVLEPVKPVVTRWNSYYAAFKRATQLQAAYNSYAEHYINALSLEDRRACQRGNKLPEAPSWMRSTGLTAADWAVITEYQDCLEPLKLATEKLEGRGKAGKYGAIYETIPVFEYVLGALEARTRSYEQVDFNPPDAPEDHLFVNLRAAWSKANDYYNKLDRSPAYYAATCLHPYYKYYCENSWVDKPEWLTSANAGFLQLWQSYKPQRTRPLSQTTAKPRHRGIDDVIGALVRRNKAQVEAAHDDEYERWRTQEPEWTSEQYLSDGHPVKYWIQLRSKYPCLSQFAIDILTIPASSCDCERLFSELGDLLEPRRRALGSELLAALQLVRSWRRAGFDGLYNNGDDEDKWSDVKDEEIVQQYDIEGWSTTP